MKKFIRSTIPIPVLFGCIGFLGFGLIDLVTGKLFSKFMSDIGHAALASAIMGCTLMFLVGWYAVRKNGLGWRATAYDVNAAVAAKEQNAGSKPET